MLLRTLRRRHILRLRWLWGALLNDIEVLTFSCLWALARTFFPISRLWLYLSLRWLSLRRLFVYHYSMLLYLLNLKMLRLFMRFFLPLENFAASASTSLVGDNRMLIEAHLYTYIFPLYLSRFLLQVILLQDGDLCFLIFFEGPRMFLGVFAGPWLFVAGHIVLVHLSHHKICQRLAGNAAGFFSFITVSSGLYH